MNPLLSLENIVGERQGRRLWGPLSLALRAGEACHLKGPNGSGKTTLLRTLAGLRHPAAGQVRLQAAPWFIGHAQPLADDLGAAENLQGWLALHGAPCSPAELAAWLQAWQLPANRPVRTFSAGQRRKLVLAPLWLAPRPLWLLDEPLDALDQQGCEAFAQQAQRHLQGGGALVLSSHQPLPAGFPACKALRLGRADLALAA